MNKIALIVMSLLAVGLAGCGKGNATSATASTTASQTGVITGVEAQLADQNWITPAKVEIGGYYAGGRAEYTIRVHLGAHTSKKQWKVTTDPGETQVSFQLTDALYQGKVSNVVTLTSDLSGEKLVASGYNTATQELTIQGFQPGASRTLSLEYYSPATVKVYYRVPDSTGEGYSAPPADARNWVTISDGSSVLQPRETKEILVTLAMPKTAATDLKKWEFWVAMSVPSADMIQTEMAIRWLITMK